MSNIMKCPHCHAALTSNDVLAMLPAHHWTTFEEIVRAACREYDIAQVALTSRSRKAHLAEARFMVAFLLRALLGWTYQRIAYALGRSDHSTAINAVEQCQYMLDTRGETRQRLFRILRSALPDESGEVIHTVNNGE